MHSTRFILSAAVAFLLAVASAVEAAGPRNVIFFIGDGMGPEQVKAANYYNGGPLSFELLPYQGLLTTYAANSSVTDSAAAATALATGYKVNNGVISEARPANPDYPVYGSELETLLEYCQAQGKSTGLVTTTYVTHATPAAFGAHSSDRNNLSDIAGDYLYQTRPNVLFGGGANGMTVGAAAAAGYAVVTNRAAMQALNTEIETMVSGQFGGGHLPYEFDGLGSLPHLSEMTDTALNILDNDPDGFFLMIEGGRIDHAGHANDIRRNVRETIELGNSVQVALDWAAGRTDTLILVTADHETGGLRVTGNNGAGNYPTVSWSSGGHTSADVPVYAWGPGADLISGLMDNTEMFAVATADVSVALTWDEGGPGEWGHQRWNGNGPPNVPDETTHAEVKTDTVTVAADAWALTLTITSGAVVVDSPAILTVGETLDVAAGATLEVAGTLNAQSLSNSGTSTIADGAAASFGQGVTVAAGATLEVAGALGAQWLTTAGTNVISQGAVLSLVDGLTVDSTLNLVSGATLATVPRITSVSVNQNGVLTLGHALAGAELNVAGSVQTAGAEVTVLNVSQGGLLSSSADVFAEDVNLTGGAIHLTDGANLNVTTLQVAGGTLSTGGGCVVIGDRLEIGNGTAIGIAGGTFQVSSANLADPAEPDHFTLSGGRLAVGGAALAPGGAIAIWTFSEAEGTVAADSSAAGGDHSGALNGASWASGGPEHPTALSFDGDDDYLQAANSGDLQLGNVHTVAMWIKTSQRGGKLLGKGSGDNVWSLFEKALYIDDLSGQLKFLGKSSGGISGTTDVADGQWHHVAVTYGGNTAPGGQEIYVDGVSDTASRSYLGGSDNGDVFRLGWAETRSGGGYLDYSGLMDDVYVYDRSLSAAEVAELYKTFSNRVEALPNVNLRVTADSTLHLETGSDALVLGDLRLEPDVALTVTGDVSPRFHDLSAGHLASIEGDLSVTGTLSPGDFPSEGHPGGPSEWAGTLSVIGRLEMDGESTYLWELGGLAADLVAVDGDLALADGWTLRLADAGGTCGVSDQLDLFTHTGSLAFGAYRIDASQVEASGHWDWSGATVVADGGRVYLTGVIVVPEPGTTALAAVALLGLLARAWRRRSPA